MEEYLRYVRYLTLQRVFLRRGEGGSTQMYLISINHITGRIDYPVYKQSEADKEGISYFSWKSAKQGQMALSDDGYVAKVIKRKTYTDTHNRSRDYIQVPWGYTFCSGKKTRSKFNAKGRESNKTLSGKRRSEVFCKTPRMKLLAKMMARKRGKKTSIREVFGDNLSKGKYMKVSTAMKTEFFKKNVKEEIDILLSKHGFTEDFTMELLQDTIILAKERKDVSNLMKAVDNLQDLHGMKDKQKQVDTRQIELYRTKNLIDTIGEVEENLKLKEVSVKPIDG